MGHPILNLPLFQVVAAFANHTARPISPRLRIPTTNMRGCGKDDAVQAPAAVPPPHMKCVWRLRVEYPAMPHRESQSSLAVYSVL